MRSRIGLPGRHYRRNVGKDSDVSSAEEALTAFHKYTAFKLFFIAVCILITLVVVGITITIGPYDIGFWESYEIIWDHISGNITDEIKDHVVINLRLPRIVVGILAGAGLAVAGAVMQGTLKNPLADPYTTGISSGASLGATVAMISGIAAMGGEFGIVVNAFVFSLIPAAVIIVVSKLKGASPTTMILSGIAVMYIFNAFTTLLMLSADPDDLAAVYAWQVGTLGNAKWDHVPVMLAFVLTGSVAIQLVSSKITILSGGDESARSLGIDANKLRIACLVVISFISASVVSFTGIIGFIGLVCPHIARIFVGNDNRYLVPASAMFGSAFLLTADLIGRVAFDPIILQVGVVTAFLGGPLFLYLILKQRNEVF